MQTLDPSIETGTEHVVRISKEAGRQLNDDKMRIQIDAIVSGSQTAERTKRGWTIETRERGGKEGWYSQTYNYATSYSGQYIYHVWITVNCKANSRSAHAMEIEFQNIVNSIDAKCVQPKWKVTEVDNKPYTAKAPEELRSGEAEDVGYAPIEIPKDWSPFFTDLYGLDPQIRRVKAALDVAVQSNWVSRFNVALIGPPGCAKSHICGVIKRMLGEEAVLEFDATSTTMAGAQKELAEREELPRVLLVEEIEKAPEASMAFLLSVLDLRGEIRKTTARGNILRDTRMVAIATVNDLPTFNKVAFGALASRFSNKVFFQRPPRAMLERILAREIGRIQGDPAWIKEAIDYAEKIGATDPREVIAIAMCGQERLLDGSYQADMDATGSPDSHMLVLPRVIDERTA